MNSRYDKDTFIIHVEDTKGVIRIRKSKDRQHNGQKEKKDKQRSTKHTHKTKNRVPKNKYQY